MGLKQGCMLSPQLFNAFLNGLTQCINELHCGVEYGDNSISMLLYADDIILIASDEHKLQRMLDALDENCKTWRLTINPNKSKIVHFRRKSCPRSTQQFHCGNKAIEIVNSYEYLGLVLSEFLDFQITAKVVSQSASRALGLLISKDKAFGGMPYECFSKCYDALVQSIINYGAAVWGSTGYSCIAAVQNRACRYFMGLGKYAPNLAIQGDMGWSLPEHRQWICVIRQWCRMINMDVSRISKTIFIWGMEQSSAKCKSHFYRVNQFLISVDMEYVYRAQDANTRSILCSFGHELIQLQLTQWTEKINAPVAVRGEMFGGNKLRTYRTFKNEFITEPYLSIIWIKI